MTPIPTTSFAGPAAPGASAERAGAMSSANEYAIQHKFVPLMSALQETRRSRPRFRGHFPEYRPSLVPRNTSGSEHMKHYLQSFLVGLTVGIVLSSIGSIAAYAVCHPQQMASGRPAGNDGLAPTASCRRHRPGSGERGAGELGQFAGALSMRQGSAPANDRGLD